MKIIDHGHQEHQGHQEHGLHRRLTTWQLTMIAIGGAIGVGLFLGSAVTIQIAGPGVLISYIIGAVIAIIMGYALAEMAGVHPVAGSVRVTRPGSASRAARTRSTSPSTTAVARL